MRLDPDWINALKPLGGPYWFELEQLIHEAYRLDQAFDWTWEQFRVKSRTETVDPKVDLSPDGLFRLSHWIKRLSEREPLAYILGRASFMGESFTVNPCVLIPRPETEVLVQAVLDHCPLLHQKKRILELGTGSGIVAITLALHRPDWPIVALDVSQEALSCAALNQRQILEPRGRKPILFFQGDWELYFAGLSSVQAWDVIVSNPPYVDQLQPVQGLDRQALAFEPAVALYSEEAGLYDLKYLIAAAKNHLAPGGLLALEHGFDQGPAVRISFEKQGYKDLKTLTDLNGQERVTLGFVAG